MNVFDNNLKSYANENIQAATSEEEENKKAKYEFETILREEQVPTHFESLDSKTTNELKKIAAEQLQAKKVFNIAGDLFASISLHNEASMCYSECLKWNEAMKEMDMSSLPQKQKDSMSFY